MNDDIAIHVEHVSKIFRLPHEKVSSVKSALINFVRNKKGYETQHVLNDISLSIKKGEFFGIVGRNGSGKSTLLKLLAGIYTPNKGNIHINGKLTPFIELGVGFNPELTGRENIYLNGALLGFSRKEMDGMYDYIVAFAELERFMDQRLKNYSSGMQVRLAFSIAIRANSDILLLDEVLAVGDAAFQKKCFEYFMQLKAERRTVVLVTHDMSAVRQYCTSAIMIEKGKIVKRGDVDTVARTYQDLFIEEESKPRRKEDRTWLEGGVVAKPARIKITDDTVSIITTFESRSHIPAPVYGCQIFGAGGVNVMEFNTLRESYKTADLRVGDVVEVEWIVPNIFSDGEYTLSTACCDVTTAHFYDWLNGAGQFKVSRHRDTAGVVNPSVSVRIKAFN